MPVAAGYFKSVASLAALFFLHCRSWPTAQDTHIRHSLPMAGPGPDTNGLLEGAKKEGMLAALFFASRPEENNGRSAGGFEAKYGIKAAKAGAARFRKTSCAGTVVEGARRPL